MSVVKKHCSVCGKLFTPCATYSEGSVFNYRLFACSPECGQKYIDRVVAARARKKGAAESKTGTETPVYGVGEPIVGAIIRQAVGEDDQNMQGENEIPVETESDTEPLEAEEPSTVWIAGE